MQDHYILSGNNSERDESHGLRILDAFCCAGGAGMGYHLAGFDVVGIDINPQPNYPFEFIQGDAVQYIRDHGHEYDAIHTSPPCQANCALTVGTNRSQGWGGEHEDLVQATRAALSNTGRRSTIEQPQGQAQMTKDVTLCGEMFGLDVIRHRHMELGNWITEPPEHIPHRGKVRGYRHGVWYDGPYIAAYGDGGGKGSVKEMQDAMGIHWTDVRSELTEAIPPAYTRWLGRRLAEKILSEGVASLTKPLPYWNHAARRTVRKKLLRPADLSELKSE